MTPEGSEIVDFIEPLQNKKSDVAEFFAHTNILVTGGTGFLEKLLVEKLLRSCSDISKLYSIVRPKKGKFASDRLKENFDSAIYDKLRRKQPNFLSKVVMLEGDGTKEEYGLSPEDKNILKDTNIIFHAAADVSFLRKIRAITNVNVRSTKFLLTFTKQLPNFKVFVYVSTVFAHPGHKTINEIHYKDAIDGDKLLTLIDILDDKILDQITPLLLKNMWPNTYVFSKAVAENLVLKCSDDFPVCIVRPSIMIATNKDPIVAWINNKTGATGATLGVYLGVVHTFHCIPEYNAHVIPADYVCNIICSAWDTFNR
ncbi:putative fatty acyl-CoA reductase CG5065 [Xylocopa sonorina]|uniref:putative fatty acyl-CoA reductase CG5065 n=1 Tax=Xylocopa sonorina TaxID=1818115 RepID=UPI00403B2798